MSNNLENNQENQNEEINKSNEFTLYFINIKDKNYIFIYIFIIFFIYFLLKYYDIMNINIIIFTIILLYYYNNYFNNQKQKEKLSNQNISKYLNITFNDDYEELYLLINNFFKKYKKNNELLFEKSLIFLKHFLITLEKENTVSNIQHLQFLRQNFLNYINTTNNLIKDSKEYNKFVTKIAYLTYKYVYNFADDNKDYLEHLDYFKDDIYSRY